MKEIKKYKKSFEYSYCQGAYPSIELIKKHSNLVDFVLIDEEFNEIQKLISLLKELKIEYKISSKLVKRLSNRKNDYVISFFNKYITKLEKGNHIILENIENMGNLGTILRSMAAFGYKNLALIGNTCDYFDPRVIRASMGSIFDINIEKFDNINEYIKKFQNTIYSFMLTEKSVKLKDVKKIEPFSLAFGNEGEGLTDDFKKFKVVKIEQTNLVDSLSIQIASAVSMYEFKEK